MTFTPSDASYNSATADVSLTVTTSPSDFSRRYVGVTDAQSGKTYSYTVTEGGVNYDVWKIYLGQMQRVPMYSFAPNVQFPGASSIDRSITQTTTTSISNSAAESSEVAKSIVRSDSRTQEWSNTIGGELGGSFFGIGASVTYEHTFTEAVTSSTEIGQTLTTSFENTVTRTQEYAEELSGTASFLLETGYKAGYYRITLFMNTDVYLDVVRNNSSGAITMDIDERVTMNDYGEPFFYWGLDYSETGRFDDSGFESFDIASFNIESVIAEKPTLDITPVPQPYEWYTANTAATTFTIRTADNLFEFANMVNGTAPGIERFNFSGRTVTLASDIDLNNRAWTSIGNSEDRPFAGTFDGGGKTIS
jgi:hypothetical protein